jgi:CHAD domain-containing protein
MAFQLRATESVAHGLRRLARKELKTAHTALTRSGHPSDETIHEARKSIKKVRAILKIFEGNTSRDLNHGNKRLRKANRVLSRLRDADARLEMLGKVKAKNPALFDEHTFARLRRELVGRKRRARDVAERKDALAAVAKHLKAARRTVRNWKTGRRGFGGLLRGIRASHRRGRKALALAKRTPRAVNFHAWRKQMKALYYELRLLPGPGPVLARDIKALHEAESALGDEHNLVVLCAELWKNDPDSVSPADRARISRGVERYQRGLRTQAVGAVVSIYDRKSRDYARMLKQLWRKIKHARERSKTKRR